jgi:hypothetical protein
MNTTEGLHLPKPFTAENAEIAEPKWLCGLCALRGERLFAVTAHSVALAGGTD